MGGRRVKDKGHAGRGDGPGNGVVFSAFPKDGVEGRSRVYVRA